MKNKTLTILKDVFSCLVLCCILFNSCGCAKKEPELQLGNYKSASGMEIAISDSTLRVDNYDFSVEEKSLVEFEYAYQHSEYGLEEGEKERTLQEIHDDTDMNLQFIGKEVPYSTQIEGEKNDKIGIYCAIDGLTTWFYLEYFPASNSIIYTPENGDSINLLYQGEIKP